MLHWQSRIRRQVPRASRNFECQGWRSRAGKPAWENASTPTSSCRESVPCVVSVRDVIARKGTGFTNCAMYMFVVKAVALLGAGDKLVRAGEVACASIPELRAFEAAMPSIFAAL